LRWLTVIFCLTALTPLARAAEGESTLSTAAPEAPKPLTDDIDQEITNPKLRAESGSKSKFSLSGRFAYTGGAISHAFGEQRPNLAKTPGKQVNTSLDGGFDARYRWSKHDSVTFGTSFGLMTPFQGDRNPNDTQLNVYNPASGYSRVEVLGPIQLNYGIAADVGTSNESQMIDYRAGVGFNANALHSFQNRLTVGATMNPYYSFYYNKPGEPTRAGTHLKPGYYGGDTRTGWGLNIYPFVEYAFSDRYSARSVFGYFNWRHLYGDSEKYRLLQTYVYQSIGVGISVSRDIYLYPNIQFVPDNLRADFTNVALQATVNVF
jgi:hypothetical protein